MAVPRGGGGADLRIMLDAIDRTFTPAVRKAIGELARFDAVTKKTTAKQVVAWKRADRAVVGFSRRLSTVTAMAGKLIRPLTSLTTIMIGGAGLVYAFTKGAKAARDFESGLAEISTLLDGKTGPAMERYRAELEKMVKTSSRSLGDLTKGLYQTISSGVTDTDKALKVLDISQKAAVAGVTDVSVAVDAMTTVVNAFQLSMEDADKASDLLFTTVKRGKTTFAPLASNIGKVSTIASQAGVRMEEMFASLSTLTKAGLSIDIATTSLRQLFANLLKPSEQAKRALNEMGIAWGGAALQGGNFTKTLKLLNEKTGGNAEALTHLIPNIRALQAAMVLSGSQLETYTSDLEAMETSVGAADTAFEKMSKTMKEKMAIEWQRIELALMRLGQVILPGVYVALKRVADWFSTIDFDQFRNRLLFIKEYFETLGAIIGFVTDRLGEMWNAMFPAEHARQLAEKGITGIRRGRRAQAEQFAANTAAKEIGEGGAGTFAGIMRNLPRKEALSLAKTESDRLRGRAGQYGTVAGAKSSSAETSLAAGLIHDQLLKEAHAVDRLIEKYEALAQASTDMSKKGADAIKKISDEAKAAATTRYRNALALLDRLTAKQLQPLDKLEAQYNAFKKTLKGNRKALLKVDEWYLNELDKLWEKQNAKFESFLKRTRSAAAAGSKQAVEALKREWGGSLTTPEERAQFAKMDKTGDYSPGKDIGGRVAGQAPGVVGDVAQGAQTGGLVGGIIAGVMSAGFGGKPTERQVEEAKEARAELDRDYLRQLKAAQEKGDQDSIDKLKQWYASEKQIIDEQSRGKFAADWQGFLDKLLNFHETAFHNIGQLISSTLKALPDIFMSVLDFGPIFDMLETVIIDGVYKAIKRAVNIIGDMFKGGKEGKKARKIGLGVLTGGVSTAIGKIFHDGGYVRAGNDINRFVSVVGKAADRLQYAHDGKTIGLQNDEVPAILQSGEGVLSRRGMAALDALNSGEGSMGSTVIQIAPGGWVAAEDASRALDRVVGDLVSGGQLTGVALGNKTNRVPGKTYRRR